MASSKRNLSARGKGILSRALEKLDDQPPKVQQLPTSEMCDAAIYRKTISDIVVEQMRNKGYKVVPPAKWEVEYEALISLINRLKHADIEQSTFNQSIKRAKDLLSEMKPDADEDVEKSDEEWEDVDTSIASIRSVSSKGAARKSNILNAKKSLKQMMQESAKKSFNQSSKIEQSKTTKLKKTATSNDSQTTKSERQPRALKRQASSVVASDAKKDKKTSTHEMDKTEFARSQNSRVQIVKERKEIKDKERNDSIKAKLQQKQMTMKEKEKKAQKTSKTVQKASSVSAKTTKTNTAPAALVQATKVKKPSNDKPTQATFAKPTAPVPTAAKILVPESSFYPNNERFTSMHNKARDDLRQGGLAKQAMFQSILAAGDENRGAINSTFLPGVEVKPDFDASLALKGMKDTFVVDSAPNATFVSKPGLVLSPSKLKQKKETAHSATFVDSFNESFRDYGLDDLCSDSDNTDDESAPTKPVPRWADMKTNRFKERVRRQRMLGQDIVKYGMDKIYMPPNVDLEMIFEEKSKRFDRHNASSGIWNDTQDFIRH